MGFGLIKFFQDGGMFMWPIAGLFFVGLAIAVERFIKLRYVYACSPDSFMKNIEGYLYKEDIKGAIEYCNNNKKEAILPRVIKSGLMRAYRDEKQIEQGIEVAMLRFYPLVKRNIRYVAVIANVATLVGLLGTIFGLIGAFKAVAAADPEMRQAALAAGISIAMNTTSFGLIVAIPCMLIHGYLSAKSEKIFDDCDEASATLLDVLNSRMYQSINEQGLDDVKDHTVPSPPKEVVKEVVNG